MARHFFSLLFAYNVLFQDRQIFVFKMLFSVELISYASYPKPSLIIQKCDVSL